MVENDSAAEVAKRRKEEHETTMLVYELFSLNKKLKSYTDKCNAKKSELSKKIISFMDSRKWQRMQFDTTAPIGDLDCAKTKNVHFEIVKIEPKKVMWDCDKIRSKIDKELCNEFMHKKYQIADMQNLVKYLKSCGVDPKEFKKYIIVEDTVNQDVLDRLFDVGDITMDDLDGCYTVKKSQPYLKITKS